MLNKATIIENSQIIYQEVYGLDPLVLALDMCEYSYKECLVIYDAVCSLYESKFGESARIGE